MELRQLRYFLAIAESENITEASKILHVSQPSLSASLRDLEKELGFDLFDRHGKKIALNDNGRYFAERSTLAMNILEDAKNAAQDRIQREERIVNCAVNIPLGHFGEFFRSFQKSYPAIMLRIGYPNSSTFAGQAIDIELFGSQTKLEDDNVIPLGKEDYVAILPPDHRLANEPSVRLRDMKNEDFLFSNPSELRSTVENMMREAGFFPTPRAES